MLGARAGLSGGGQREDIVTAHDLMTLDPVTVTPRARIADVWDLMRERRIRHAPVVEDGVLVGMVSDRDLAGIDMVRVLTVEGTEALREELATPIIRVMSADVVWVEPESELEEVVDLLIEHRVGAIPVVRPDTREVLGIISYIDVLRALRDRLEE